MGLVRQFWPDPASQNQRKTWFYFAWGEFITEGVSLREIKDEGKGELEIYSGLVLKIYLSTVMLKGDIFSALFSSFSLVQPYHTVQRQNSGDRGIRALCWLENAGCARGVNRTRRRC